MIHQALQMAVLAHNDQIGEDGLPYILHPLRVMLSVRGEIEQVVAILHDVVEDTSITLKDIEEAGFPKEVLDAIDALTRRTEELYQNYIDRVHNNIHASTVKLMDLEDNLGRCDQHDGAQRERILRYETAKRRLLQEN